MECGLKVCISNQFKRNTIPELSIVQKTYRHDLTSLTKTAGLEQEMNREKEQNVDFGVNWDVVKDWDVNKRYVSVIKRLEARDLLEAIEDQQNGVLQWLRRHW